MKTILNLVIFLFALTTSMFATERYELVVFESEGTNESCIYSINESGFSVGYKIVDGKNKPCLWTPARGRMDLPTPSGSVFSQGIAYSISENFEIAGTFGNYAGSTNPYKISNGAATVWIFDLDIADFTGYEILDNPSMARDISDNGEIAGNSIDYAIKKDVYSGNSYSLPSSYSYFYGINNQGNLVGSHVYDRSTFSTAPVFVKKESDGSHTIVSGSTIPGFYRASALKVNTNDQVVGLTLSSGFYWEPQTGSNILFVAGSECHDINNFGTIVGMINGRAHMWVRDGKGFKAIDLNTLVVGQTNIVVERAFSINNKGQIVGQCLNTEIGVRSGFMLTPAKSAPKKLVQSSNGELELSWLTKVDHVYSIRFSEDLKEWFSYPDLYQADSDTNVWVRFDPRELDKVFFEILDLTP